MSPKNNEEIKIEKKEENNTANKDTEISTFLFSFCSPGLMNSELKEMTTKKTTTRRNDI